MHSPPSSSIQEPFLKAVVRLAEAITAGFNPDQVVEAIPLVGEITDVNERHDFFDDVSNLLGRAEWVVSLARLYPDYDVVSTQTDFTVQELPDSEESALLVKQAYAIEQALSSSAPPVKGE